MWKKSETFFSYCRNRLVYHHPKYHHSLLRSEKDKHSLLVRSQLWYRTVLDHRHVTFLYLWHTMQWILAWPVLCLRQRNCFRSSDRIFWTALCHVFPIRLALEGRRKGSWLLTNHEILSPRSCLECAKFVIFVARNCVWNSRYSCLVNTLVVDFYGIHICGLSNFINNTNKCARKWNQSRYPVA
jgi:hypothetical protein